MIKIRIRTKLKKERKKKGLKENTQEQSLFTRMYNLHIPICLLSKYDDDLTKLNSLLCV